jgi:hypothetical protein
MPKEEGTASNSLKLTTKKTKEEAIISAGEVSTKPISNAANMLHKKASFSSSHK